jgi:uncharacterized protein YbcC (UPF0753/DUF2309 family)
MQVATTSHGPAARQFDSQSATDKPARRARLRQMVEHAAHLLPSQGPITVFVHHNTLHAFEDLPFDEAVNQGARLFGCQPYLPEDRYRQELARGRIRARDLEAVLREDLVACGDATLLGSTTRLALRMGMLQHPLRQGPDAELRWLIAETDALRRFRPYVPAEVRDRVVERTRHWVMRDLRNGQGPLSAETATPSGRRMRAALADLLKHHGESSIERWADGTWEAFTLQSLWRACHQGVHGVEPSAAPAAAPLRHRDLLLEATGEDSDRLVSDVLIRLCAAFLDQGLAQWRLPNRDRGLYQAFLTLYRARGGPPSRWMRSLRRDLERLDDAGIGPLESIEESLQALGVGEQEQEEFLSATLLALRGWAGMIWQMETRSDRAVIAAPPGTLVEYLAVRLILERHALAEVGRTALRFAGPLNQLRKAAQAVLPRRESASVEKRAFLVFQLAQVMEWTPEELFRASKQDWSRLVREVEAFPSLERRRVFHEAYERRYYVQALDALAAHCRAGSPPPVSRPRFQLFCCIDDREESFRRHLEEVAPDVETFGAAAFYNVAMYYRGAADAHFTPLCPIVVRPQHWVVEDVALTFEEEHRRRRKARRLLGMASHRLHAGSRTFTGGVFTALLGSLATAPLMARVLFPRVTAQLRRRFGRIVEPPPVRQLVLERTEASPGPDGGHIGFTVPEMAGIVERLLRESGLTSNFARLVILTGHGSSSLNNPHESAYNCGACAGGRGGPNARAFAQMANDPRVRELVAQNGLEIPDDTVFLGAYHNTCDDSVTYFDVDRLPTTHKPDFVAAKRDVQTARERNAHERCRRFESAPLNLSAEAALRHVEGRSEDLAQTRPEYNHATNALTIVGRRSRTRGLFLDRRAFLSSYDPKNDDDRYTLLERVLQPVVPVCAGISLEYYFSCVDPAGYGCNSKLPHNVASMLGVMLGAASDLMPGLNAQMIEIHEPLRQLFIVETTPEALLEVMRRNPAIDRLCRNDWARIAVLHPDTNEIRMFRDGRFELFQPETAEIPEVESSLAWYRGWRDHLGFAAIKDRGAPTTACEA